MNILTKCKLIVKKKNHGTVPLTQLSFSQNIFQTLSIPNRKSYGAEVLRECSSHTMCHVSSHSMCHLSFFVMCHVSHVTCPLSPVTCHLLPITCQNNFFSLILFRKKKKKKVFCLSFKKIEQSGGGQKNPRLNAKALRRS